MGSKRKNDRKKKRRNENLIELPEQDEYFAFIAGYTSGGAPYGITWEEWEQMEKEDQEKEDQEKEGTKVQDSSWLEDLPFD